MTESPLAPSPLGPREMARLCRRVANIRTSGGHRVDRVLRDLAAQLESRPSLREHRVGPRRTDDQLFEFRPDGSENS
jgi:hypothetical protein